MSSGISKQVALTSRDQTNALEAARAAIASDAEDSHLDPSTYAGDVTDGEVVRIACRAYVGTLRFEEGSP